MAIVLVLVVVLVAVGGGVAFFVKSKSGAADDATRQESGSPRSASPSTVEPQVHQPDPSPRLSTPEPRLDDLLSAASEASTVSAAEPGLAESPASSPAHGREPITEADDGGFDRFGSPGTRAKKPTSGEDAAPAGRVYDMELEPEPAQVSEAFSESVMTASPAPQPGSGDQMTIPPAPSPEFFDQGPDPEPEPEPVAPELSDPVITVESEPAVSLETPSVGAADQEPLQSVVTEPEPAQPEVTEPAVVAVTESPVQEATERAVEPGASVSVEPEVVVDELEHEPSSSRGDTEATTGDTVPSLAPDVQAQSPAPDNGSVAQVQPAPAPRDAVDHVLQALIARAQERKVALAQVAAELVEQANLEDREIDEVLGDLIAVAPEERENVDPNQRLEELTMFNEAVPKRPGQINAFDQLASAEKKRVIIRVLCLLVALQEDYKLQPSEPASEAETRSWPLARAVWPVKAQDEDDDAKPIQRRKNKLAGSR